MILFFLLGLVVSLLIYFVNILQYNMTRSIQSSASLLRTYECGFESLANQSRTKHYISYYIIALLYVIFDLEVALILPAIISLTLLGTTASTLLIIIMSLLCLCFVYE